MYRDVLLIYIVSLQVPHHGSQFYKLNGVTDFFFLHHDTKHGHTHWVSGGEDCE